MMALTREPSARRASTIGELSSMRRPTLLTMRSITRSRCLSSWKRRGHALEHALPLDVDLLVRVDQDVVDRRVAQQRLERPEAEHVVENLGEQRFALAQADRRRFLGQQLAEQRANLALGARAIRLRQRFEVEPVQQLAMDVRPQLEILRARAPAAEARRDRFAGRRGGGAVGVMGRLPDRR